MTANIIFSVLILTDKTEKALNPHNHKMTNE